MTSPTIRASQAAPTPRWRTPRLRTFYAIAVMCMAVIATYFPVNPEDFPAGAKPMLTAMDFMQLHSRRIRYAREALFGPAHYLPAWYTRELGGTPFWSNLQSFPMIPSRLATLLLMPALQLSPEEVYAYAVQLAALLSAVFTFF